MVKIRVKPGAAGVRACDAFPGSCQSSTLRKQFCKGMYWEAFDRLEQKGLDADREKMLITSAEISPLEEGFGELPTGTETTCWMPTERVS
jgi:hypothetical protein